MRPLSACERPLFYPATPPHADDDDDDDDADGAGAAAPARKERLVPVDGPADGLDTSAIIGGAADGKRLTRAQIAAAAEAEAKARRAAAKDVARAKPEGDDDEGEAIADFEL